MPIELDAEPDDLRATIEASFEPETSNEPAERPDSGSEVDGGHAGAESSGSARPKNGAAEAVAAKGDHPTDPARYADGKFKPTKSEAAPDKVEAGQEIPSKDTQTQASAAAQPASAPPAGWTAAEKAEWSKLSPVAQAAVSRRELEIANGGKQWSEEKRRYEAMVAPVAEAARARGMDTATGIQVLARAQAALDTDPVSAIKHIAKSYGVDLATLAGTQSPDGSREANPQPTPQPYRDPRVDQIWQAHVSQEQARQQQTVDLVTTFATSPGHEHFEAVSGHIMALLPVIQQANPGISHEKALQDAYDQATYANPTTRAAIKAAQDAEAEAKRIEAAKQRANAARLASSSVTGSPNGSAATGPKDSLRAEIEAAFAGG